MYRVFNIHFSSYSHSPIPHPLRQNHEELQLASSHLEVHEAPTKGSPGTHRSPPALRAHGESGGIADDPGAGGVGVVHLASDQKYSQLLSTPGAVEKYDCQCVSGGTKKR